MSGLNLTLPDDLLAVMATGSPSASDQFAASSPW